MPQLTLQCAQMTRLKVTAIPHSSELQIPPCLTRNLQPQRFSPSLVAVTGPGELTREAPHRRHLPSRLRSRRVGRPRSLRQPLRLLSRSRSPLRTFSRRRGLRRAAVLRRRLLSRRQSRSRRVISLLPRGPKLVVLSQREQLQSPPRPSPVPRLTFLRRPAPEGWCDACERGGCGAEDCQDVPQDSSGRQAGG